MPSAQRKNITPKRIVVLYTTAGDPLTDELREASDLTTTGGAVVATLRRLAHVVEPLEFDQEALEVAGKVRAFQPEIVFNLAECPLRCYEKEPHAAMLLELLRLPYTGNGPFALTLCKDKAVTKQILIAHGVATPRFRVYSRAPARSPELSFPLMVKPLTEDGSLGIAEESIVANQKELRQRVAFLYEHHGQHSIVEEFLCGREFSLTVLGNGTADAPHRVLPPGELVYHSPKWRVCSFDAKWDEKHPSYAAVEACYPAQVSANLRRRLEQLTLHCARIFKLSGYARIDFRLNQEGEPHVLEVNPNPNLSPGAGIARTAELVGLDYGDFLQEILRLGLAGGAR